MDPTIEATTDDKLVDHHATYHSCECPALLYKSKVFRCPWTNDQICKHIYRVRLKVRLQAEEDRFAKLLGTVFELYGEKAEAAARVKFAPHMLRELRKEVARQVPPPPPKLPRGKKARQQALDELELQATLQEARVC